MHYFKRNIGDYHKKAGRLSMLEHGAYTLLIDACYDRERFPTRDEALDWCWARTEQEIAAVDFVLAKFFDLVDGRYVQNRIQEEIDEYHQKALKNKEIALAREAARKEKRERIEHEACTNEHESPPNHKPITINQEPITSKKSTGDKSPISLTAWLEKLKAIGDKAIPDDDSIFSYAEDAGIPNDWLRLCWIEFRTEFSENGKRQKDWRAHFRNFVRKNYYKLWWLDNGHYQLTSRGQQAMAAMQARAKRDEQ